ncbi:uncharacterized protein LOC132740465 [Ruditapes philippinarum]|uniref:uncharacterized protein LOC132740465 n=1 Tax=Ruditapes philippinarum TaxID=129788 RepID=UPI00295A5809|nr:uncharacterized protein LOC132740465 [Ruditapes philippinarum]XP_060584350.1 uncharacterized protein LOC132740465 [Ruditapes philippinarum]
MVEPIGWSSMRNSLHYKSVFPTVPDVGMQVTLHRNLAKRLQPKETVLTVNQYNIEMARRILHRQRVALRLYSGSRLNLKGSTAHETSARLHRQPLRHSTCPDGFYKDNSDAFSNMRSEGSTLLTEASVYGTARESITRESTLPVLPERVRGMSTIPGSARSDLSDSPRYANCDPEKLPDSRGYLVKLKKPIVYKKKYTEKEVQNIVNRLSDYDPISHPAESKGYVRQGPAVVSQVPRQSMTQVKKCTAEEVQEIVERLYSFDNSRFPAESKSRPVVYSGRPRVVKTAPAEVARQIATAPLPPTHPSPVLETDEESKEDIHAPSEVAPVSQTSIPDAPISEGQNSTSQLK